MPTIFIAGIYGVGKSSLCTALSQQIDYPFFSASDLISQTNGEKYGSNKVVVDKNSNQEILVDCVNQILINSQYILLAGHFCIVNKLGEVDIIPESVFDKLHISKIILLESSYQRIIKNLASRDSKTYTQQLIEDLKTTENIYANNISNRLSCPLYIHQMQYSSEDIKMLLPFILTL